MTKPSGPIVPMVPFGAVVLFVTVLGLGAQSTGQP